MKKADLCSAFCEPLAVTEVPIGFAVKTPFRKADGDALGLYVRRNSSSELYRIEDDGETIPLLEAQGVDLESETRFEALSDMLREHDAFVDESENVIHTSFVAEADIPSLTVRFSALMLRINDLLLLARARVRSTFREDLIRIVEAQFGSHAEIGLNAPLNAALKDYVVDIIVRAPDGRSLAIYAATSELKALECLLFSREQRDRGMETVRTMLVLETSKPREIKERTLSRVMNSTILLASMDGEEIAIRQKMENSLRLS